jgi:hypothetical protein
MAKIVIPDVHAMAAGDGFSQVREIHTVLLQLNAHLEAQDERLKKLETMLLTREEDVPRPRSEAKGKANAAG